MSSHNWIAVRDDAMEAFNGETPGPQLEQDILTHFAEDPEHVIRTINRIARSHEQKPVNSCWAVLRADLNRTAQADITVNSTKATNKRLENARAWIRNAGCHYDLERHIEAELFGDDHSSGILTDIQLTDAQKAELVAYWQDQRPRGIKAEQYALAWMKKCGGGPARMREILANARTTPSSPSTTRSGGSATPTEQSVKSPASEITISTPAEPAAAATGGDIEW